MLKCPKCNTRITRKHWLEIKEIGYGEWDIRVRCKCWHTFTYHKIGKKTTAGRCGYIYISVPREGSSYLYPSEIPEHRYVWERVNGKLPDGWIVHHINGKKDDNRIENLIALPKKNHNNSIQKWGRDKFLITCPFCNKEFSSIDTVNK